VNCPGATWQTRETRGEMAGRLELLTDELALAADPAALG
jgi:hypothetical protein